MKKIISLLLVAVMMVASLGVLTGCGNDKSDFKVGFIFLNDASNDFDKNFIDAAKEVADQLLLATDQVIFKTNIAENEECYEAAVNLIDQGCDLIFANSPGHEEFMIKAAKEFPDVQFCQAFGTQAQIVKLPNYHNAFADMHEGRYLSGVAAGKTIYNMIKDGKITPEQAKIGYVAAEENAESISAYTAFYLGAKSVFEIKEEDETEKKTNSRRKKEEPIILDLKMEVEFTHAYRDEALEEAAANKLIKNGCVVISQQSDSLGAPRACEAAGVPNFAYNTANLTTCPNTFVVATKIDWIPYFKYMISAAQNDIAILTDWSQNEDDGTVKMTDYSEAVDGNVRTAVREAVKVLKKDQLEVFDITKFTVNGQKIESYTVDVGNGPQETIVDGYFHESDFRSAPYFDIAIDGITVLNAQDNIAAKAAEKALADTAATAGTTAEATVETTAEATAETVAETTAAATTEQ